MSERFPIRLRPKQQEILNYLSGKMGISAVPGSGKTWTLSLLAAEIIARGEIQEDQEVLVVTLVNSAVDNFYQRVSTFMQEGWGLLPYLGYRVRTLHGLAHDIVRDRPGLVGLADNFQIIDEREANAILGEITRSWLKTHPADIEDYLDAELDESRRAWELRERVPDLIINLGMNVIRYAKDLRMTPERLRERLDRLPLPLPLADLGCSIFSDYQRALIYRGAVDFDDLISLALQALESDVDYLARLQYRWPFILEDEAQDSSRLQEEILKKLVGLNGNWVRVGDPNQAIFETFTTASPHFLRQYIQSPYVEPKDLPNSGRSTLSIINLANYLVDWTQTAHPVEEVRDALQAPPWIEPVPEGDPQKNPEDNPNQIYLSIRKYTPQEEVIAVADSLENWLPEHPDHTVAVLAPRNQRGFELADVLKERQIDFEDGLLRSSSSTRLSAGALANILNYLSDPGSARKLSTVFRVWRRADRADPDAKIQIDQITEILRKLDRVEDYLWPEPDRDWLSESEMFVGNPEMISLLVEFRQMVQRWQAATLLPADQIVLTLAQDLLMEPPELAISHKLAVLLRQACQAHPSWRLPELTNELAVIARNERRFIGFSGDDIGFDPEKYKGRVVISTIHKAKGLEWDRVYLMSVNNYDFPSGQPHDTYIAEKDFIRDHLNLEAEALSQLQAAFSTGEYQWYEEGVATMHARLDYVRERLRLFYVGITRAKSELIITWNSGRYGNMRPADAFLALYDYWEKNLHEEVDK